MNRRGFLGSLLTLPALQLVPIAQAIALVSPKTSTSWEGRLLDECIPGYRGNSLINTEWAARELLRELTRTSAFFKMLEGGRLRIHARDTMPL